MAYSVKEADVRKDRDIMVKILTENRALEGFDFAARYDWVYLKNPVGVATAWIIWDDKKNIPVGFTGVFPREIYIDGKKMIGWNCGDFSIEKKYRTLGIALKLRKKAKEAVDEGKVPFLYAHPNERMEVIHIQSGHKKIALMKRYALPIRANKIVLSKINVRWLANLLALPINVILSLMQHFRIFLGMHCEIHDPIHITDDHEALFKNMTETFRVIGARDSKYLKWKFGENPNYKYAQFDMFYKNNLVGTIFYIKNREVIHISDILIDDFERFASQLFRFFIKMLKKNYPDINSISIILQEFNPYVDVIKKIGFRFRDDATSASIVYANADNDAGLADIFLNGKNWYMTVGDRDA